MKIKNVTSLGKRLRKIRIDNDEITLNMAEKLGISTVTMSAIDVGRKKLSEQMLEKLETMLPKDDFIDLLKSEREMNLPSFLLKKFEKYNIQSESITDITNISEISEEGKRKIYDFIELVKISERARNNRETVNITNLSTENKEKAREYIELLEIKQEKK